MDLVPRPDPTVLTTQQLNTAVESIQRDGEALREILETRIEGQKELSASRFDAMDKAISLLQVIADRQPLDVDKKIINLQTLHEEKFDSIQTQFTERDVRTEQTARDSKVAVDAALQAAKEAVGEQNKSSALAIAKSEAATTKQIDQQGLLISSATAGLNDKIEDLKERLTRLEGQDKGLKTAVTQQQTSNMNLVSVIGLIMGTLIGIGGIVAALVASRGGP